MYDLLILGGGPAGYNAAERASHAGLSTVVFEGRALGGVCLNEGCIPSKALLNSAGIYYAAQHGEAFGVFTQDISLDHGKVIAHKNKVVKTLVAGIRSSLKGAGATVVKEQAEILGREADGTFRVQAGGTAYEGKRLLVCTGSMPTLPPIPGLKEALDAGFAITNREVLDLTAVPARLVIVGGGVIGLEMAQYYAVAGSKVTVVEMLPHVGGPIDPDMSDVLQKELEHKGVEFLLSTQVTSFGVASVLVKEGDSEREIACDAALVSIGRRPVTAGYGLEKLGVLLERGAIVTDDYMRTSVAGVWAAGDVNGRSMLAHTAYREGEVAVADMLGQRTRMRYDAIPAVIYTKPEVGMVGLTEQAAKDAGYDVVVTKLPMQYSGRYVAEVERGTGFCKLVFDKVTTRLLGAHLIGNYASEIIHGAAILVEGEYRVHDIRQLVYPHPTVSEIIREAAFACPL